MTRRPKRQYSSKMVWYQKIRVIEEHFDWDFIYDLVEKRPINIERLKDVKGLGDIKINKYGQDILNIVNKNKVNI